MDIDAVRHPQNSQETIYNNLKIKHKQHPHRSIHHSKTHISTPLLGRFCQPTLPTQTRTPISTHLFITNQFNQSSPTNYIMMNAPSISVHTLHERPFRRIGFELPFAVALTLWTKRSGKTNKTRSPGGSMYGRINIMIIIIISSKLWKPLISDSRLKVGALERAGTTRRSTKI